MPVRELSTPERNPEQRKLLDELIAELQSPREFGQPQIIIRPMPRGGLRHVYVIWDKWDGCPPEVRGEIIREAFAATRGTEFEHSIALAIPATVPEAAGLGLIPFEVKPFRWYQLDEPSRELAKQALIAEGASLLGPSWLPSLRYRTEQEAEEAVERLRNLAPIIDWGVVQTVLSPE